MLNLYKAGRCLAYAWDANKAMKTKQEKSIDIKAVYNELFAHQMRPLSKINFDLKGGALRPTFSRLTQFGLAPLPPVDPAVIMLILKGALFLISLFKHDDGAEKQLAQIGEWLKEVQDQLQYMSKLLDDIREELIKLGLLIKAEFTQLEEDRLFGVCMSYATNIGAYKANPDSPMLQKLMSDLYPQLQADRFALMNHGYAPTFSVFLAFRIELDLVQILRLGKQTQSIIAKSYNNYFDTCLNEVLPGSCPNALKSVEAALDELRPRYTAGDKGLIGPAWWYRDNPHEVCHAKQESCNTGWDL